jgi:hypothetical protein
MGCAAGIGQATPAFRAVGPDCIGLPAKIRKFFIFGFLACNRRLVKE